MASRGLASAQGRGPPRCASPWFSWMNRASTSCLARSGPYRPRGAHAGPPRVADARPPLGHGGCHAGGQDLHPDASGGAQRVAHHRVPQAPDPACRISTLGNLGRVAHPSPRRSRGVPCQRHGTWPSRRAVAAVCPGLESRRRRLATPQACRDAQLGLPRRGRTPSGTSPGRRPLETKATRDSIVLRVKRTFDLSHLLAAVSFRSGLNIQLRKRNCPLILLVFH